MIYLANVDFVYTQVIYFFCLLQMICVIASSLWQEQFYSLCWLFILLVSTCFVVVDDSC